MTTRCNFLLNTVEIVTAVTVKNCSVVYDAVEDDRSVPAFQMYSLPPTLE